jgi:hypothetical protein
LAGSGSHKLKKDPPDDPWYNRRANAERPAPETGAITLQYDENPEFDIEMDGEPMQQWGTPKIAQLAGQKAAVWAPTFIPPSQPTYARETPVSGSEIVTNEDNSGIHNSIPTPTPEKQSTAEGVSKPLPVDLVQEPPKSPMF